MEPQQAYERIERRFGDLSQLGRFDLQLLTSEIASFEREGAGREVIDYIIGRIKEDLGEEIYEDLILKIFGEFSNIESINHHSEAYLQLISESDL